MSSWVVTSVGEFAPFSYGKGLPAPKRNGGRIPVVGSGGVSGWHDEPLSSGPVVVIGRKGTVGSVQWFSDGAFPIDTTFYIEPNATRDLKFTYYLLQTLGLEKMSSDSAVPGLNRDRAHTVQVRVPPLAEQRRIAGVLGALDDLIDTNEKTTWKLNELGRALTDKYLSRVGETVLLSSLIRNQAGKYLPSSSYHSLGQYPVFGSNSFMGLASKYTHEGPFTVLARIGSNCGALRFSFGNAWVNNNATGLISQDPDYAFLNHALLQQIDMSQHVGGSGQPFIRIDSLLSQEVPRLPEAIRQEANALLRVLAESTASLTEENHSLSRTRDELLPLLMSGKIRVREAEEVVASLTKESA